MYELYMDKLYNSSNVVWETEFVDVNGLQVGLVHSFRVAIVTTAGVRPYSNTIYVTTDKCYFPCTSIDCFSVIVNMNFFKV